MLLLSLQRRLIGVLLVVSLVFGLAGIAYSATYEATPRSLKRTLRQAAPGDTVLLVPGNYGVLSLRGVFGTPSQRVTLRAQDAQDPPRFEALKLENAEGLILDRLVFDYSFKRRHNPGKRRVSEITRSKHIAILNTLFDGDIAENTGTLADGYGASFGLSIRWSEDILVQGSVFHTWFRGLVISQSTGVTLRANQLYEMRSDGADFAEVTDVLIERNHFHSFQRSPESKDHPDMIQFWTAGTKTPSRNITIRDNVLNAARGAWTQSIFMRNELVDSKGAGPEMFYRNVSITGNVIINAHLHGITVGETDGLMIKNNTLVRNHSAQFTTDNPVLHIPTIRVKPRAKRVRITDNIVGSIDGPDKAQGWRVVRNLMLQESDATAPGYHDDVFVAARYGDPAILSVFTYLPDGPAGQSEMGASLLRQTKESAQRSAFPPLVRVTQDRDSAARFVFDASLSGTDSPQDLKWTFSDGTIATGTRVTHDFPGPGQFAITAQRANGPVMRLAVAVPHPQVLRFDGQEILAQADNALRPLAGVPVQKDAQGQGVIRLEAGGDLMKIKKTVLAPFFGARGFRLDLRLRAANTSDPTGEILRIHNNLVVTMTPTGGISFWLNTAQTPKPLRIATAPLDLFDRNWHDISLRYDARDQQMRIFVNDKEVSRGTAQGRLRPMESWGLSFGNPFGKKSFEGDIAMFDLQAAL